MELGKEREQVYALKRQVASKDAELASSKAAESKAQQEVARLKAEADKAKDDANKVRREVNQVRGELKAAQEAAAKEKQQFETDKAALEQKKSTLLKQTHMKIQRLRNLESVQKLLPHVFGFDIQYFPTKVAEGEDKDAPTQATLLLTDSMLAKLGQPAAEKCMVKVSASISSLPDAEVTLHLPDQGLPPALVEAKSKYLPETATAAAPCGVACILSAQVNAHYTRLASQQAPLPAGAGTGATTTTTGTTATPAAPAAAALAGAAKEPAATKTVVSLSSAAATAAAAAGASRNVVKLPPTT